jgi:hypothetical protein
LYLGTDSTSGQGVLQSLDGGVNWNIIGLTGDTINALAVSPVNPSTVYAGLNGGRDAFLATLTSSGQLYSSTYLGGSGLDQGSAVALTSDTSVVLTGSTSSSDFLVQAGPVVSVVQTQPEGVKSDHVRPAGVTESDPVQLERSDFWRAYEASFACPSDRVVAETCTVNSPAGFGAQSHLLSNYQYSSSGNLPPGFRFVHDKDEYFIDGTATQTGTFVFTVSITAGLCKWSVTYVITVIP